MAESRSPTAVRELGEVWMLGIEWDREQLERGEARMLAHNFKNKEWLEKMLKRSERIYGKGSGERIKAHMRTIWRDELCK